jgi:hypothetical protein
MTIRYWLAKNIEDSFRNETRNVGVIVQDGPTVAARFVGERESAAIDRRLLGQRFRYPDVYLQWVSYWRREIEAGHLESVLKITSDNYYLTEGGEVSDTGIDPIQAVCSFLYTMLVSDEHPMQAFDLAVEEDETRGLGTEISEAFKQLHILGDSPQLIARHPISRDQAIRGKHVIHRPSFSQQNGRLYIYEAIDFTMKRPKLIRERAGWMSYMYIDIKEAANAEAYSIYRPADENQSESVEYAKKMLGGESRLINWSDESDRSCFLNDRQKIAESIGQH